MSRIIRVGSRDSVLAVKQAQIVMNAIKKGEPEASLELVKIKTDGDRILDKSLSDIGGKGLFIKELEQALKDGIIDIAVHSYKDMPYEEVYELPVLALSERESPFDVLVLPEGAAELDTGKPVGTSSLRRITQLKRLYPGIETGSVRGNVHTRLHKLDSGGYSALILAEAGLNRLSLQNRVSRVFTAEEMIPSGSQGIIAVQGRRGGDYTYLEKLHSRESEIVSKAERRYLTALGADCASPVAVYGQLYKNELSLAAMFVDSCGEMKKGKLSGAAEEAERMGEALAKALAY